MIPALSNLKKVFRDKLLLCVDICLCAYTNSGHCCVFDDEGNMDTKVTND